MRRVFNLRRRRELRRRDGPGVAFGLDDQCFGNMGRNIGRVSGATGDSSVFTGSAGTAAAYSTAGQPFPVARGIVPRAGEAGLPLDTERPTGLTATGSPTGVPFS
jgi:hypothetical protein